MIASLMLDPDDSIDFPGNTGTALGRPLSSYPLIAARGSRHITRHFVVTGSPPVKSAALQQDAIILDPPPSNGSDATARAQLAHGLRKIHEDLHGEDAKLELMVVLFAHSPAVTAALLDQGIEALHEDPTLDSAVSVSPQNRWNPFYAHREGDNGLLEPYVPYRPEQRGDIWYPDWGVQVLRPKLVEAQGDGPFPWLGRKVHPLKQWGGGPVDFQWQIPSIEYWLKKHGVSDLSANLELQPKPQLQPKTERRL